MNVHFVALAVAATLASGALHSTQAAAQGRPAPVSSAEIEVLKEQLSALQQRLAALEVAQQSQLAQLQAVTTAAEAQVAANAEQQEAIDRTTDTLAQTRANVGEWVGRFQWKGDLRYRNETIDQQYTLAERNRDRIRARLGFFARVNDTLRVEVQATTTEGFDSRSSNQTLTNANSRKALDLDAAYAEWSPNANLRFTFGKMRYPWVRTGSYFYDSDVNPEGIALSWQQGALGLFGSAFYTYLAERSAQADSNMIGAQLGWRGDVGSAMRLTLAAGYFDHGAVEGYNPFLDGNAANAFGNTTTSTAICRRGIATCLTNDFNVLQLSAELGTSLGGRPLSLFVDYARNSAADRGVVSTNPTQNVPAGLDMAYAAGFTWGRTSNPFSWEIGYTWQKVEKDALFGQWIDSDFAAGLTDSEGGALRLAFQFSRNWRLNATYIMSETNVDVPFAIPDGFVSGCTGGTMPATCVRTGRDYKRLQLDFNMTF